MLSCPSASSLARFEKEVTRPEDRVELVTIGQPELVQLELESEPTFHEALAALCSNERQEPFDVHVEDFVVHDAQSTAPDQLAGLSRTHAPAIP